MMAQQQGVQPQQGLHNWAMWRISVNHDMIRGLHVNSKQSQPHPHWRHHSSDQRFIDKTPQGKESHDVSQEVRSKYGKPPSRNVPMGNNTYFLYGLPRVTVNGVVPNVVSSHYESNLNLASNDSSDNNRIRESRRVEEPLTSKQRMGSPSKRELPKTPRTNHAVLNSAAPGPLRYLDEVIEAHSERDRSSPINFRDRPEVEYQPLYESKILRDHEHDKVLNKPVVVPPSVFRTEVLRRSFNADDNAPSDGFDRFPNDVGYDDDEGFEDPRYSSKFKSQQHAYAWEDVADYETDVKAPYVDESHMKTHV